MTDYAINIDALRPLYGPAEEPNRYRMAAAKESGHTTIVNGRRPSSIPMANSLRHALDTWRQGDYPGTSETSRELLYHWFQRDHVFTSEGGEPLQF
ncbi:MAG: hypothetical protein GX599_08490, partial [Chloroflexi bacterium]|nr:hypothetical protein [Chloroflexota bacterium]